MWRSAKDRGTNDNNNGITDDINNRRRIRNMVKQLDEIGRDRDPQVVVSMIVFSSLPTLVLLRFVVMIVIESCIE